MSHCHWADFKETPAWWTNLRRIPVLHFMKNDKRFIRWCHTSQRTPHNLFIKRITRNTERNCADEDSSDGVATGGQSPTFRNRATQCTKLYIAECRLLLRSGRNHSYTQNLYVTVRQMQSNYEPLQQRSTSRRTWNTPHSFLTICDLNSRHRLQLAAFGA
jgi:hypothetical protein